MHDSYYNNSGGDSDEELLAAAEAGERERQRRAYVLLLRLADNCIMIFAWIFALLLIGYTAAMFWPE